MKRIYLVRHGQTGSNVGNIRGSHGDPLTDKGFEQAAFIAQRLEKLPVDALIASTMTRAQQTGSVISERIHVPLESSDLFVEARAASEIQGMLRDAEDSIRITKLFFENFGKPDWRYSDEENFLDLKERAEAALELLAARPEDAVAVVTHGFFMRILLASAVFGKELTAKECLQFTRMFDMENTGLSILKHNPKEDAFWPWSLWVWNDHAHLG